MFYHTGHVYCQFGVCSVCKVHFTLARAASKLTARQQVQSHCGLEAFPVTSIRLQTHDGMRWLWNVVGDASRALELGVFVGGPWKGNCSAAAVPMGRGGALLNISVLVFLFRNGFPLSFTDVHSVCGFIITPRSARCEVHEAVKEDPCLVRYEGNSNQTAWKTLYPSSGVSDHGVRLSWTPGSCNTCKVVAASYDETSVFTCWPGVISQNTLILNSHSDTGEFAY